MCWGGCSLALPPSCFPTPTSPAPLEVCCLDSWTRPGTGVGAQLQKLSILTSFVSRSPAAPASSADQTFSSPQVISFLLESLCSGPKLKPLFPAHFPRHSLSPILCSWHPALRPSESLEAECSRNGLLNSLLGLCIFHWGSSHLNQARYHLSPKATPSDVVVHCG